MASIFSNNIYNQLLVDLSSSKSIKDIDLANYLIELRPLASKLYKSLQNDSVSVNYADEDVQIAYVLRYFPVYWEQIFSALTKIYSAKDFKNYSSFNIGLFGSGPCPEIIGIIRFFENLLDSSIGDLNNNIFTLPKIIHSYDQSNSTWKFSKNTFIHPPKRARAIVDFGINIASGDFDFTKDLKLPTKFQDNFYDICCFQNCLNEFHHLSSNHVFKSNLLSVIAALNESGYLIISDREFKDGLSSAKKSGNEIISICLANGMVLHSIIEGPDNWYNNKKDSRLPGMMRNLFTFDKDERLIPTFENRRFIYILRKIPSFE